MRLGLQLGYDDPVTWTALARGGRTLRVPLRVDVGGLRLGRGLAARVDRVAHDERPPRDGDHADARSLPGDDRGDGRDARPPLRRSGAPRARHVRPAGRRGLARAGVGQAARPARASTSRSSARSSAARRRSSTTASTTTSRTPGPDATGLGKPLQDHRPPAASRRADLPRRDRPEERRARGGDRRRLAADLLLARALRGDPPADARRGVRAPGRPARGLGPRRARARRRRPTTCRRPRLPQADPRPLRRRAWARRARTSTPSRGALRLRGRGGDDPGPLSRREEERGDRRGAGRARRRGRARR